MLNNMSEIHGSNRHYENPLKDPPTYSYLAQRVALIYRWLWRSRQLGRLVPVFILGVPLRCKASKLEYPLRIPTLIKKKGPA